MVRKVRHLVLRDSGFYARVSVPHALRVNVGKTELWAALSATSRAEAIRRLPATVARLQGRIDAARAEAKAIRVKATPPRRGRSLTRRQLALVHYEGQIQFDDELRNTDHRYAHEFVDNSYVTALRGVISGAFDNRGFLETVGRIADRYQRNRKSQRPIWHTRVASGTARIGSRRTGIPHPRC